MGGGERALPSARFFSRTCVFLLSKFSLVAANKAFYCGVVSAMADTVSARGVPVPGPNPQTNSREGQGQASPLLSLGIAAEQLYLSPMLCPSSFRGCQVIWQHREEELSDLCNMFFTVVFHQSEFKQI